MVLVPLNGALDAVKHRLRPGRIVARIPLPVDLAETVSLEIALVDHPQAVLVAQIEEVRVWRVVTTSHCVDVVPLHQQDILEHDLHRDGPALVGVKLVPVHTPEHDSATVDLQDAVLDGHGTEADLQRYPLPRGD
jgi:hypothetical protein